MSTRIRVYGGIVLAIGLVAVVWWGVAQHRMRERAVDAERVANNPQPVALTQADVDHDQSARLETIASLQTQLGAIVEHYCETRGVMPRQISDLPIAKVPELFAIDTIRVDDGVIDYRLRATKLVPAGTIRYAPDLDGRCAKQWRCSSADFPRIAKWLPDCVYASSTQR